MRRIGRKRTGGWKFILAARRNSHEAVDVNVIGVRVIRCRVQLSTF